MSFTLYKKIARNYQDFGLKIASIKILKHLFLPFYVANKLTLYELNIETPINYRESGKNIKFILLEENDENIASQMIKMEEWLKSSLNKKLLNGSICSVALHNNEVIGFNLASSGYGEIPTIKLKVKIDDDSVWGDQISVKKNYRNLGISYGLRKLLFSELKKRGIKRYFACRATYNIASIISARKVLKHILGNVSYRRFLFIKQMFLYKSDAPIDSVGTCISKKESKTRIDKKDSDGYFVIDIDTIAP